MFPSHKLPRPARILSVGAAGLVILVYVALLYWFDSRDFYHGHFFDHGMLVRHYVRLRLLFIFCFAWLVYAVGVMVLTVALGPQDLAKLPARERFPLGYLVGVAVWTVLLCALGLAGLYTRPLAIAITMAVMLGASPHLVACIDAAISVLLRFCRSIATLARSVASHRPICTAGDNPTAAANWWATLLFQAFVVIGIAVAATGFLLIKGLYPGGGHDYYGHYFPYYVRVIQTGSVLPNDVWYHFYLSKGDGLYFLAMLLTDPLAPQLVAAGFILCAACIVYALLRRVSPTGPIPWIGVFLYLVFFIYTPGPQQFMTRGGWGDLEKEHELTAVLLLGVIWCAIRLNDTVDGTKRPWIIGLHASIVATILTTFQLGFLVGLYLFGFMLWFAVKGQRSQAVIAFFACLTASITMAVVLAVNYDLTGLVLDQAVLLTWPFVNLVKVAQWGALFEVIALDNRMLELSTDAASWSQTILWLLPCYLRLEIWWPLVGTAGIFAACRAFNSRMTSSSPKISIRRTMGALLWFAAAVTLAAMFGGGRSQPISFYRVSSFSYAPTLCIGLTLWLFGVDRGGDKWRLSKMMAAGALIVTLVIGIAIEGQRTGESKNLRDNVEMIVHNAHALWSGRYSVADAYQNQQGWPGRMPWGGIYPGLEQAWRLLPPLTRVWSYHIYTYCMLPDCNFQGYLSFIFSPQWYTVYFGTPEAARAALHAENLNYFFFSKNMEIDDPIGHAPLFSPDNIAQYLRIRWTNGTDYLLTWPGPDTRPLDESFLSAYRDQTAKSDAYRQFNVEQWKTIATEIEAQKAAGQMLHPFPLPWCSDSARCATIPSTIQGAK
jgi:hypothetical protein